MRKMLNSLLILMAMVLFVAPTFAEEAAKAVDVSGIESIAKMILNFVVSSFPVAGMILGSLAGLIVLGRIYVAASPSKSDDAKLQKLESKPYVGMLFRLLAAFSPVQRKDK